MINDPRELLTHLYVVHHRKKRPKLEEIQQILDSEECLKRIHDKGNFALLLSATILRYATGLMQKIDDFKTELHNQKIEKPRKEKNGGGKQRKTKKREKKYFPTLQELVEQELQNPSNVESISEKRSIKDDSKKSEESDIQKLAKSFVEVDNFMQPDIGDRENEENTNSASTQSFGVLDKKRKEIFGDYTKEKLLETRQKTGQRRRRFTTTKRKADIIDMSIVLPEINQITRIENTTNDSLISIVKQLKVGESREWFYESLQNIKDYEITEDGLDRLREYEKRKKGNRERGDQTTIHVEPMNDHYTYPQHEYPKQEDEYSPQEQKNLLNLEEYTFRNGKATLEQIFQQRMAYVQEQERKNLNEEEIGRKIKDIEKKQKSRVFFELLSLNQKGKIKIQQENVQSFGQILVRKK